MTTPSSSSSMTTTTLQVLIVGGSKGHVQESISGRVLELYQQYRWKMIPNCTGRYTCRDHDRVSDKTPMELLQALFSNNPENDIPENNDNNNNNDTDVAAAQNAFGCYQFHLPGKDTIWVLPLDDTNETGIISYVKQQDNKQTCGGQHRKQEIKDLHDDNIDGAILAKKNDSNEKKVLRFVHTLNTRSGFRRKLNAMAIRVTDTDIFLPPPLAAAQAQAQPTGGTVLPTPDSTSTNTEHG